MRNKLLLYAYETIINNEVHHYTGNFVNLVTDFTVAGTVRSFCTKMTTYCFSVIDMSIANG
jgi:hypothetical protein